MLKEILNDPFFWLGAVVGFLGMTFFVIYHLRLAEIDE